MKTRVVRLIVPFVVSGIALALVLALADLSALAELRSRMRWNQLPTVVLLLATILLAFAWRWQILVRSQLAYGRALNVVALGLAGNQLLPFRGGDALRAVISARGGQGPSLHTALSALAMEKVLDLIAVAALGLVAATTLVGARSGSTTAAPQLVLVAAVILVPAAAMLVAAGSGALGKLVRSVARLVRLPARYYRHVVRPIQHLRHLASPRQILLLLAQTAVTWIVLYALACSAMASMVGVDVSFTEAIVLLFGAALGLAIPAAPSGVGTLHAGVVSAFVLLDRPTSDGLLVAIAIHAVSFLWFCVAGGIALGFAGRDLVPWLLHRRRA